MNQLKTHPVGGIVNELESVECIEMGNQIIVGLLKTLVEGHG